MMRSHYKTFSMVLALIAWTTLSVSSGQTILEPTDDAWAVTAGGSEGTNLQDPTVTYGVEDENRLWVRAASSLGRGTYLKFDLTGIGAPVSEAVLAFTVDVAVGETEHTVFVYELKDESWTEETITGENRPEFGEELGSASTPRRLSTDDPDTTFEFDVTQYVNAALQDGDAIVAFGLGNPTGATEDFDGTDLRIFSKEAFLQGDGPVLIVTSEGTSSESTDLPSAFTVAQNYPNPFNPETKLTYEAPAAGALRITVYNVLGQEIAKLFEGSVSSGQGAAMWDGRDSSGKAVETGVYLARFEFANQVHTVAMTLLR